jgi:hypothetical protein
MHELTRRLFTTSAAVVALGALSVGTAAAHHAHHLALPNGNCADRGGAGFGTGQAHDAPGSFHLRVHMGTPGQFAFAQPNNPVAVVGGSTC